MLPPNNSGPNVKTPQYVRTRCENGRSSRTRQISFSLRSMVRIKASAVTNNTPAPNHPSWPALLENWCRYLSTERAISLGTRLWINQFSTLVSRLAKAGKALKMASATVNSGTKAITVVKVRLLAVSPNRSSRKRSRRVNAVLRHGNRARSRRTSCQKRRHFSVPECHLPISVSCHFHLPK